jgi:ketose-bisphosphate aldolase
MELQNFTAMLRDAKARHYTVAALNTLNMETVQAVTAAAAKAASPVIVQIYHKDLAFAGAGYIAAIAAEAARESRYPVCLSLDHGQSFDQAMDCIAHHFTGVMIDLSTSDFERNIADTKRVVAEARARGVSVEAELGKIFSAKETADVRNSAMTDPEAAAVFAEKTGVDALAVSIGTAHGLYASAPVIDFARLDKIIRICPCPIVVHGGSDVPDEQIKEMVRLGVAKLNIGTDLMMAFKRSLAEGLAAGPGVSTSLLLSEARRKVQEMAAHKFELLNAYRVE